MASSTAAKRPRNVALGPKIMGRDHAAKAVAVRRPQYDERGKFVWNGITFAQACLGATAPAQQDFFVQVVEDVMKWGDCWTTTGRKAGSPDGSRRRDPLEVVRQCAIAHGGQPLGWVEHMDPMEARTHGPYGCFQESPWCPA